MHLIYLVGIHMHDLAFRWYRCCCSLLRLWAIKMNDDDGFQSAGRAESCFAAQSWSRQGQTVLEWCSRSHAVLWSSQRKHGHSSEGFKQKNASSLLSLNSLHQLTIQVKACCCPLPEAGFRRDKNLAEMWKVRAY